MDTQKLNDWLQVVGLFGVLGGLIFVGLQVRQDRQIAESDVVFSATNAQMYWAELIGSSEDLWVRGMAGEPLTPSEQAHFDRLAAAWQMTYYYYWYATDQLGVGEIPRRFAREFALDMVENPGLRAFWLRHRERMERLSDLVPEDEFSMEVDEEYSLLTSE